MDNETIGKIMSSDNISDNDKITFQKCIQNINNKNMMSTILELPDSIQNIILKSTNYKNQTISTNDKKELILMMKNGMNEKSLSNIPNSVKKVLLNDSEIDGEKITSEEKFIFLEKMSGLNSDKDIKKIYSKVDKLPKSINNILSPTMNMNKIKNIALFLVVLYVISALFTFIQSILMTDVSNNFAKKLRSSISKKINRLPLKYFDKNLSGDILSRVTNDVDTIAQSMNQSLASLVSSIT